MVLKQIDQTLNELNDYSSKIQSNQFTLQDYQLFQSSNYATVKYPNPNLSCSAKRSTRR